MLTRRLGGQHRADPGGSGTPDALIVEEPLAIRLDDILVSSTMRTPGDDFELAAGFLHAEGMLGDARITGIRYCGSEPASSRAGAADPEADPSQQFPGHEFNAVSVDTGGRAPIPHAAPGFDQFVVWAVRGRGHQRVDDASDQPPRL